MFTESQQRPAAGVAGVLLLALHYDGLGGA